MPYTLTAEQRTWLQSDLGVDATETVFTNAQLDDFYNRGGGDLKVALVYGLRYLYIRAARLFNYSAGSTSEQRSAVFKQLSEALKKAEKDAGMSGGPPQAGWFNLNSDPDWPETEDS